MRLFPVQCSENTKNTEAKKDVRDTLEKCSSLKNLFILCHNNLRCT